MKFRTGFVSNSSSSSFIVAFDIIPGSKEELQKMLWGNDTVTSVYDDDEKVSVAELADIVWHDFQRLKENPIESFEQFVKVISEGYFPGFPMDYDGFKHDSDADKLADAFNKKHGFSVYNVPKSAKKAIVSEAEKIRYAVRDVRNVEYKEYDELIAKAATEFAEKHWYKFEGKLVLEFHYSDNDAVPGAVLEHGGTFDRMTSIQISHH